MAPVVAPMEDTAPMEEPNEELATLTAMASGLAEEPGVPPVPCEEKEEGRYLVAAILAGQKCCTPLRLCPLLGKLP